MGIDRGRLKREKHGKVKVKGKWWVLVHPPNSLQENGKQSLWWKSIDKRLPDEEDNPGNWYRQKLGGQGRPQAHFRCIHVKTRITQARGP